MGTPFPTIKRCAPSRDPLSSLPWQLSCTQLFRLSCHHISLEATETAVAAQEVLVTSRSTSPALRVRTIPSTPRSHRPDLTATEEWREATMLTLRLSVRPSIFVPTMERAEGGPTACCAPTAPSSTRAPSSATGGSTSTAPRPRVSMVSMTRTPLKLPKLHPVATETVATGAVLQTDMVLLSEDKSVEYLKIFSHVTLCDF